MKMDTGPNATWPCVDATHAGHLASQQDGSSHQFVFAQPQHSAAQQWRHYQQQHHQIIHPAEPYREDQPSAAAILSRPTPSETHYDDLISDIHDAHPIGTSAAASSNTAGSDWALPTNQSRAHPKAPEAKLPPAGRFNPASIFSAGPQSGGTALSSSYSQVGSVGRQQEASWAAPGDAFTDAFDDEVLPSESGVQQPRQQLRHQTVWDQSELHTQKGQSHHGQPLPPPPPPPPPQPQQQQQQPRRRRKLRQQQNSQPLAHATDSSTGTFSARHEQSLDAHTALRAGPIPTWPHTVSLTRSYASSADYWCPQDKPYQPQSQPQPQQPPQPFQQLEQQLGPPQPTPVGTHDDRRMRARPVATAGAASHSTELSQHFGSLDETRPDNGSGNNAQKPIPTLQASLAASKTRKLEWFEAETIILAVSERQPYRTFCITAVPRGHY